MPSPARNEPLFDLVSLGRRGPGRERFSREEIAYFSRTARRTPEVIVKVLGRGGQDSKAVRRHLDYLRFRETEQLSIESDDGRRLDGQGVSKDILQDWNLEIDELRHRSNLDTHGGGSRKLVHKLMFSMPAGTPSDKVLAAVKGFAREEFALKHRYAMVLHTDEPHPHVHMIVKAMSEQGDRLHIRKATLREWRHGFARHLRSLGVEANATARAVRGATAPRKLDGIYRVMNSENRHSTHMRRRVADLLGGNMNEDEGKSRLIMTREEVERSWRSVSRTLVTQGMPELAAQVSRFVAELEPPRTENELLAARLFNRPRDPRSR
jgi:hypothetical protein